MAVFLLSKSVTGLKARPRAPPMYATLAILAVTGVAHAQASQDSPPATGQPGPEGGELQEVVITAQKRTERLEDVPVSASVVAADQLALTNATDISDLTRLVPSLDISSTLAGRVPLGIRGISSNANQATAGLESGVALMVDGVPIPSDSVSANDLEDVKSVEVLKGPQETLGGRSAAAGIINVVTRGPADRLTGDITALATSDHEHQLNGFVAGPLGAGLEGSLSAYDHQVYFPLTNLASGVSTNKHDAGARGKLLYMPTEALSVQLTADYHESITQGANLVYAYVTPGAYLLQGLNPHLPPTAAATLSQATLLSGVTPSWDNQYYNSPQSYDGASVHDNNYNLDINYNLGGLTLGSTTAFQHELAGNEQDLFDVATYFANNFSAALGLPWMKFYNNQTQAIDIQQLSEELKLVSSTDRPFSYVAGVFYEDQRISYAQYRALTPAYVDYDARPETRTYDAYGRSTWNFLPATSLVAGLRLNYDQISYTYSGNVSGRLARSANADNSTAVVGDVSLQQQIGRGMFYAAYSRGYNPAVFNLGYFSSPSNVPPGKLAVTGQEHVDSFEVGSKGIYFDQRVTINVALFDTLYSDYQVQTAESIPGNVSPVLFLVPAAKAETRGAEFEGDWTPIRELRLGMDLAYVNAVFKNYRDAPCWGNAVIQTASQGCIHDAETGQYSQNVSGMPMPDAPKLKASLSVEDRIPLSVTDYELIIGGNYAYRTSAQMLPDQNPEGVQSGFGLLNVSIGIGSQNGKYSLTAFVNNLLDHHYVSRVEDFWSSPWNANAVAVQPARDANRYGGVRFTASL